VNHLGVLKFLHKVAPRFPLLEFVRHVLHHHALWGWGWGWGQGRGAERMCAARSANKERGNARQGQTGGAGQGEGREREGGGIRELRGGREGFGGRAWRGERACRIRKERMQRGTVGENAFLHSENAFLMQGSNGDDGSKDVHKGRQRDRRRSEGPEPAILSTIARSCATALSRSCLRRASLASMSF
jgi:hypothetical protein